MMKKNLATVTVTFNRKELLIKNIKEILAQNYKIDLIIIVDNNSKDDTQKAVFENFPNENIKYIYLKENIGGAGGFYTGCKYAYEHGFEWIVMMDDDGKPKNQNTILNLMNEVNKRKLSYTDEVMFNSLVLCDEENLTFGLFDGKDKLQDIIGKENNNIIENKINPFNGTLISRGLIKKIGLPNRDFFISWDEQDYYYRALSAGAKIATVVNSLYYHPQRKEQPKELNFFSKKVKISPIFKPWMEYYRTRNSVYIYKREGINIKKHMIKKLFSILIYKCKKVETLKMVIKGYKVEK